MQIFDTFATQITDRIEPVVKVADRRPALLLHELRNLIVTPQWEQHFRRVFDTWAEASSASSNVDPGIWISGFFGSGKSLLMKVLGVVLEGGELQGHAVHEIFLSRLAHDGPDRGEITRLLTTIRRKTTTSFVGGNIHALQSSSSESLALIAFKLFAKEQGYTNNWAFSWAVEYHIDQAGKKQAFQRRAEEITNREWDDLQEDTAFYIDKLVQAAADTLPEHFDDGREAVRRSLNATTQSGITPSDVIDRLVRWCRAKDAEGRSHKVLIQLDEIGQWIASGDSNERIMQVQALVETASVRGEGRVWIAVTAHGDIQALQANVQQDQYAKINQRFSQKIKLSNDDMSQVVEERLLQKNEAGQADLAARFAARAGQIGDLGSLKSARRVYPVPTEAAFPLCYPYLPWTIKVVPDIVKGVAQAAGRGDALTGATRTMISVVQGAILDTPGLLQAPIGKLLNLVDLYPQLVVDVPVETKTDINSIQSSVKQSSELTSRVAIALYLLGQAQYIPCTIENLARAMVSSVDDNLAALAARIEPELNRLIEAGYAKQVGDEYLFLTAQQRSFQDKVRERRNELQVQNFELIQALKEFESDDIFQLSQIQSQGRPLKLVIDSRQVKPGQSSVIVHVISPLQRAFASPHYDDEPLRQKSNQEPETFFLRMQMDEVTKLRTALALFLATREVADRVIAANPMSAEAEVARQAKVNDLNSHQTAVRTLLRSAMRGAQVFFRGSAYHLTAAASSGDAARGLIIQLLPLIYYRLSEVTHRVANEETAVRAALSGTHTNMDIQLLAVLKADATLNESSPLLSAVRGVLPLEGGDRPAIEATELRRMFEDPPFGWDGNAVRVALALLFRAGSCKLVIDGRVVTDPGDPNVQLSLAREQRFRQLKVVGVRSEIDTSQLIAVRGFFEVLFGRVPVLLAATLNTELGKELELLGRRCAALQQWAAAASFPLPAAFSAGVSVMDELLANPNPVVRLPHFAERYQDLSNLLELLDRLEQFRDLHAQPFQQIRDYFTSMINAGLNVHELQVFLSRWNTLQSERQFHDEQRWNEVVRARDAAERAIAEQVTSWTAQARQRAEATVARIPDRVREIGGDEAQVAEQAPRLAQPFEAFLAALAEQPALGEARSLGSRVDLLELDLRGALERLREIYNPPPPPKPIGREDTDDAGAGAGGSSTSDVRQRGDALKRSIRAAIESRRGQPEFRQKLLCIFEKKCLVTGCKAEEALEAAHIDPYCVSADHDVGNGLILRADIHTLFDLGLLAIDTEQRRVILDSSLVESYGELTKTQLEFPTDTAAPERKAALDKHRQGKNDL